MEDTNLNSKEAARYLKLSPQTLANWRSQGRGPRFRKCGRKVIYPISELRKWEDSIPLLQNTNESLG